MSDKSGNEFLIKRWSMLDQPAEMAEDNSGEYVKYEDYAKLKAENEQLRDDVENYTCKLADNDCFEKIEKLESRIRELEAR